MRRRGTNVWLLLIAVGLLMGNAGTWTQGSLAGPADPAPTSLDLVGQVGGTSLAVAVVGETAFVGIGPRLVAFDIGTPDSPVVNAQSGVLDDVVMDVSVAGGYAYVANGAAGLAIVDIGDASGLPMVGAIELPGRANGVAVSGSVAYVTGERTGLVAVDISNPNAPTVLGSLSDPSAIGVAWQLAVDDGYAFIAILNGEGVVVDVGDPSAPLVVGSLGRRARDIVVTAGRAYLADPMARAMHVLDVSEPTTPRILGSVDLIGEPNALTLDGTTVYVAVAAQQASLVADTALLTPADERPGTDAIVASLAVVDVSDDAMPRTVAKTELSGEGTAVAAAAGHVFVAANDSSMLEPSSLVEKAGGLRVVDVRNPTEPEEVAVHHAPGGLLRDVAVHNEYAVVTGLTSASSNVGAVWTVDLATPSAPVSNGFVSMEFPPGGVAIADDLAYVVEASTGLMVVDVAAPSSPSLLNQVAGQTYMGFSALAVEGVLYVAEGNGNLSVHDLRDPISPEPRESLSFLGEAVDLAHAGANLYVAGGLDGVLVCVDLTEPLAPEPVWAWEAPDAVFQVATDGSHAYLAMGGEGIAVLDLAEDAEERLVGSLSAEAVGYARALEVDGERLYVVDGNWRVLSVDVSEPARPVVTATEELPSYVAAFGDTIHPLELRGSIAVAGVHLLVSLGPSGLLVFRTEPAATPTATLTATNTGITPSTPTATVDPGEVEFSIVLPAALQRTSWRRRR